MIKGTARIGGHKTLIIGLTLNNVRRLQAEQPIYMLGEACGSEHDVLIVYGADTAALAELIYGSTLRISPKVAGAAMSERDIHVSEDHNDRAAPRWLIWSNEHAAWWRPRQLGYTRVIEQAGRYTAEQAGEIVDKANRYLPAGQMQVNEVMVRAPLG